MSKPEKSYSQLQFDQATVSIDEIIQATVRAVIAESGGNRSIVGGTSTPESSRGSQSFSNKEIAKLLSSFDGQNDNVDVTAFIEKTEAVKAAYEEISHCNTENGVLVKQLIKTSKVKHTETMDTGHKLEKFVLKALEAKLSVNVKNCGLVLDLSFPVFGAFLDAIGADFVVEGKCPISLKTELKLNKKTNNYMQVDASEQPQLLSGRLCQIVCVITGTLTALSDGMQYGWTSPSLSVLQSPSSTIKIKDADIIWLEYLYMLGGLTGLPITVYLLDKLGRKKSMLIAAVENLVAWILLGTANSVEMLFVARFLAGLGGDINFVATPTYIAEISDKEIRGCLGSVIYIMMSIGILLIYCIGPFVSITMSSGIGAFFIIIQLATFPFMPRSPYYLLVKNQIEEARKSLQILKSSKNVENDLNEIGEIIRRENQDRGRPLDLFKIKSNRKAFFIMAALNFGQHFSGISVMLMNFHTILEDAESIISSSTAAILFSFLMLLACFVSAAIIDKAGRKFLLGTSSFLTGVLLLILASYFSAKNSGINVSNYNWVPIFVILFYAIVFKCGLGLVPIVITAELYPTNIKAVGCAVSDAMYLLAGGISLILYHILMDHFGIQVPLFLFGFCCFVVGCFLILVVPETKGKTLEEIQQMLKGEFRKVHQTEKVFSKPSKNSEANYNSNLP
ncbi:hypothetical protein RN001_012420 [Aquatica leii]|uniref:Major facilitator superfamily (MFS) profile domain-containing protein n=1 Tax=Aquatica leii TaxID=1421715 RepID=A0AAN7SMF8_9COLE|nr:hypothetical protein RN001_012420 [Aquatica leii]